MTDELVPVWMSDCRCPGAPHPDGDYAYLRPYLLYAGGAEALRAIATAAGDGDVDATRLAAVVTPVYLRHGIVSWNRVDEAGEPVPVTDETIAALRWEDAYEVADRADDLYGEAVLRPLLRRTAKLSPGGPTAGSTSANSRSPSKRRTPSARS
jgi:hypothetical protein